jgi:hypothetical protein
VYMLTLKQIQTQILSLVVEQSFILLPTFREKQNITAAQCGISYHIIVLSLYISLDP